MIRLRLILLAPLFALSPAAAQTEPDWSHAASVEVKLSNFDYAPSEIHLKAGQPVRLLLVNTASGGHDFTAKQFFAAASVRSEDRAAIHDGGVELRGHQSREIALVPKAGRYPLKCTHTFHKTFGMSGTIVVG
jgi:plastocyanin